MDLLARDAGEPRGGEHVIRMPPTLCCSFAMPLSRPEYLATNLTRPIPTKDRGVLRTVADARDYMAWLPEDREFQHHWQQMAKMILDQADVTDVSRRIELALFYDGKLDLRAAV
jgi:hypothetical protein